MSPDATVPLSHRSRPQRVLACILCQQRKVKCDRKFPCSNCTKAQAQCIPGTLSQRQRRRRFPERDLLERIRMYEDLLRQNNISFDPLHKDSGRGKDHPDAESGDESESGQAMTSPTATVQSEKQSRQKTVWHAMSQGYRDPGHDSFSSDDDVRETAVKNAWEQSVESDALLLFGSRQVNLDLSALHPDPVQIFRLWQVYLDNVNPLLKVTHTPSLQGRIIEAAGNLKKLDATLEALMFSMYCLSVLSLSAEDCQTMFGFSKEDLGSRYQLGCQQALFNCRFLRSSDRDCLTALFLYLVSIRSSAVSPSLSCLLGVAIRIAQRMGIHNEANLARCSVLEAEMRRRLWWALAIFDTRISEVSNLKIHTLDPTWDCRVPLNVNDSDLRPEMKEPPANQSTPSEALFIVVRGELGEFIRHSVFHLDFTRPSMKPMAKYLINNALPEGLELNKLEETIEDQYFKFCDLENPIHFMTVWTARANLAKCRLMYHHSRHSDSPARRTEAQLDVATSYAIRLLECDTKIMTSPLTKRFVWMHHAYFPFPSYIQIVQDLKRRPMSAQAPQAWDTMSANYEAWKDHQFKHKNAFFHMFAKIILQAWGAREAASEASEQVWTIPRIVSLIRESLAQSSTQVRNVANDQSSGFMDTGMDDFPTPTSADFANPNLLYNMGIPNEFGMMGPDMYSGMLGQSSFAAHLNQLRWGALSGQSAWGGF